MEYRSWVRREPCAGTGQERVIAGACPSRSCVVGTKSAGYAGTASSCVTTRARSEFDIASVMSTSTN